MELSVIKMPNFNGSFFLQRQYIYLVTRSQKYVLLGEMHNETFASTVLNDDVIYNYSKICLLILLKLMCKGHFYLINAYITLYEFICP